GDPIRSLIHVLPYVDLTPAERGPLAETKAAGPCGPGRPSSFVGSVVLLVVGHVADGPILDGPAGIRLGGQDKVAGAVLAHPELHSYFHEAPPLGVVDPDGGKQPLRKEPAKTGDRLGGLGSMIGLGLPNIRGEVLSAVGVVVDVVSVAAFFVGDLVELSGNDDRTVDREWRPGVRVVAR